MKEVEYSSQNAVKLVGGRITGVFTDKNKEHWGFTVVKNNKKMSVWVEQDTEGNGPGDLFIDGGS